MGWIAELRTRAQRTTGNLYDTVFTRRVSIYLTAVLYPLGVSANAVSALGCFVAVASCVAIGLGTGGQVIVGVGAMHLFAVLDSVDGELARLTRRFTLRGLFLEDLAAFTMINGMFLAVGGYVMRTQGLAWPFLVAVVVVAVGRNAMQVARRALLKSIATRRPIDPSALANTGPTSSRRSPLRAFVETTLLNYTNVWVVLTTLILLEELAGMHHHRLVLIAFCSYAALVLLKEVAAIATYMFTDALEHELVTIYATTATPPTEPRPGVELVGE